LGIVTANEVHVPLSTAAKPAHTSMKIESADVAHSFWVPQLAGKMDAIPGITNTLWMDPRQEGIFLGNCAEYCGTQHANMLLRVIVEPDAVFQKWVAAQKADPVTEPRLEASRAAFLSFNCINCHAVSGTPAVGQFGPDLTHLMSRATLGSGVVPNTV